MLRILAVKHGQGRAGVIQKTAKAEKTAELHAKFADVKGVVLSDYCGLNVQQMSELCRQLTGCLSLVSCRQKTLGRRAIATTDLAPLTDYLVGTTAVALAANDVVAMAKAPEFAEKEPKLASEQDLLRVKSFLQSKLPLWQKCLRKKCCWRECCRVCKAL